MIETSETLCIGDLVMSPDGMAKVIETRQNKRVEISLVEDEIRTYVFSFEKLSGIVATPKMLLGSGFTEEGMLSNEHFRYLTFEERDGTRSGWLAYTEQHYETLSCSFEIVSRVYNGRTSVKITRPRPLYVHELQHAMVQCDYYVNLKL